MLRKTITAAVLAVTTGLITAGPVLAGILVVVVDDSVGTLPAPGILGLVAIGIVGAIAIARSRK